MLLLARMAWKILLDVTFILDLLKICVICAVSEVKKKVNQDPINKGGLYNI